MCTQGMAATLAAHVLPQLQVGAGQARLVTCRGPVLTASSLDGETAAATCLDVAGSPAPRPHSHRIHVIHRCLMRCLGLADAVCCAEEGVSRSGTRARVLPLGFFIAIFVDVLYLIWVVMATSMNALVLHTAPYHPRPRGRSGVAPLRARASVHLAGMRHRIGMRAGPMARALGRNCTASTSPTWQGAPTGPAGVAEEARTPPLPLVAPLLGGSPRTTILGNVTRLPARGVAGSACGPASGEASSQRGAGGGKKGRPG